MTPCSPRTEHAGRGYKVPNGGVYASAADLCRLIAYARKPDVAAFSDAIWAELQEFQTPESLQDGYGLGFFVELAPDGQRLLSHGGSIPGYTAYWAFDPDRRIGAAILRNYNSGRTSLSLVKSLVREVAPLSE
ncbi:MAG: CubicO group peptidase (beta-lactamase class C family) [Chlamydiales bacterium]